MTSPFESAVSATLRGLRNIAAVPVRYTHGGQTVPVNAMQGRTEKMPIEVSGREQVVEQADFLIPVDGLPFEPAQGDLIERDIGDTTYIWLVCSRFTGEPVWDWSDTKRTQYRVHCRKNGEKAYEVTVATGYDLAGNEIREQQ